MRDGILKLFIIAFLFLSPNVFSEPIEGYAVNLKILDKKTQDISKQSRFVFFAVGFFFTSAMQIEFPPKDQLQTKKSY